MTRAETQEILQAIKHYLTAGNPVWHKEVVAEALDIAIEALTQDSTQDLISRSRAIDACLIGWNKGYEEILADIKTIPSADAVEVVRCKDCKHWHQEIRNGIEYINFSSCDLNHYGDGHNFYCADAERRTDG